MAAVPSVIYHTDGQAEKGEVIANEKPNSDGTSSPGEYYDDLPDPDAGKSDEERARLVRPLHSLPLFFIH